MICSAWSGLTLPRRTLQEILDLLFWLGACGMLFFCGIVFGQRPGAAVHGPVPAAGGNGLFSSAQPLDPAGAGHPGPAAARFLGWVTAPLPVAYSCSHGSVGKNFKKVEKNLEKVLFFFPVVEYNMSSNRETWQICRP